MTLWIAQMIFLLYNVLQAIFIISEKKSNRSDTDAADPIIGN